MSKIEDYQRVKYKAEKLRQDVRKALGDDSPENDKYTVHCQFTGFVANVRFTPMSFVIHAYHGYYGSPSTYSDTSRELGEYLAEAINESLPVLMERAVSLAEEKVHRYRDAAEEDAREVLEEIEAEKNNDA